MNKSEKRMFYDNLGNKYNKLNKSLNEKNLINSFLNKTLTMFLYNDLPIPYFEIEKLLQMNGVCFITEYNNELVALPITLLFDDVDIYGNAKNGNVYFADTKEYKKMSIENGVLFSNDFLQIGLLKLFNKYAHLMNESLITLENSNIFRRAEKIFIANDDITKQSVNAYLKKLETGEIDIITSNLLFDSLNVSMDSKNGNVSDLIEYDNYIKAQFYNEIGLYYNDNMKKERLITSEIETGLNSIYPLVDNMLNCRKQAIEQLNEKYNLYATVEFTSSWDYRLNLGENIKTTETEKETETESDKLDD